MIRTVADLHTHTSVSQHAYSSLDEMARSAAELGLAAIGITDHGPGMMDGAIRHHFYCMRGLPKAVHGLRLVAGAKGVPEVDGDGGCDLLRALAVAILVVTGVVPFLGGVWILVFFLVGAATAGRHGEGQGCCQDNG